MMTLFCIGFAPACLVLGFALGVRTRRKQYRNAIMRSMMFEDFAEDMKRRADRAERQHRHIDDADWWKEP